MEGEKRVLRLGGIAGLLAGLLVLVGVVILGLIFPGPEPTDELLARYAELTSILTLANVLLLIGPIVAIGLVLSLYRTLKETSPEFAWAGLLLYVLSVGFFGLRWLMGDLAFGPRIAELYVGGTDAERSTIVLIFEALVPIGNAVLTAGNLFLALAALSLGAVMVGSRDYGRRSGGVSLLLGLLGLIFVALVIAGLPNLLPILVSIAFFFVFGWKAYTLSRSGSVT